MTRQRRSADFDSIIVCTRSAGTKNSNLRDATKTRMGRIGARSVAAHMGSAHRFLRRVSTLRRHVAAIAKMQWRWWEYFSSQSGMTCSQHNAIVRVKRHAEHAQENEPNFRPA
jgi:hypothetical protein